MRHAILGAGGVGGLIGAALARAVRVSCSFCERKHLVDIPVLLADPDQRRRLVEEFDLRTGRFTGRSWAYHAEDPISLVADAKRIAGRRLLVMERDDLEGAQAHLKRVYAIDLDKTDAQSFVAKREVVDLLDLADPDGVSLPAQPGDRGLGNPFSFPLRSVESILPLSGARLMVANDNNYPFDAGRHPGQADGNEWIVVRPACGWRGGSALPASAAFRPTVGQRIAR